VDLACGSLEGSQQWGQPAHQLTAWAVHVVVLLGLGVQQDSSSRWSGLRSLRPVLCFMAMSVVHL
jgi:hypothetical protein